MNVDKGIFAYLTDWLNEPEKILLEYYSARFTQSEFKEYVLKTAEYLKKSGFGRAPIGIMLPNIPEAFFVLYAASAAGGVANLINPRLPLKSLKRILERTGTKVLFLYDKLYPAFGKTLAEAGVKTVLCSPLYFRKELRLLYKLTKIKENVDYFEEILKYPPAVPEEGLGFDAAAYIHSGGTTGEPKTAVISAKALNALEEAVVTSVHPDPATIPADGAMLMMLPLFHGFGLGIAAHTVACRIRVVMEPRFIPGEAARMIKKHRVTHLAGVPSMYRKLCAERSFGGKALKNLSRVFCGGDVLSPEVKRAFDSRIAAAGGTAEILEGYGLTETASVVTVNPAGKTKPRSQGRPLNGNLVRITDGNKILPAGETGEIEISAVSLMSGYLGDDDATARAIYTDSSGRRWLKTGDTGRLDPDGYLYFSERAKRSLKIAAINIFPSEIEAVAATVKGVSGACAARKSDRNGKPFVCLYVEIAPGASADQKLKNALKSVIASEIVRYAVPREIVFVDKLKYTAMGKVDYLYYESESNVE